MYNILYSVYIRVNTVMLLTLLIHTHTMVHSAYNTTLNWPITQTVAVISKCLSVINAAIKLLTYFVVS